MKVRSFFCRKPVNPWGSCFDSAAKELALNVDLHQWGAVMCHGICIANKPGEEGNRIAHAWLEFDHPIHGSCALDPIWMIAQPAAHYRQTLKIELAVTYTREDFIARWRQHNFPGPWDARIRALTRKEPA